MAGDGKNSSKRRRRETIRRGGEEEEADEHNDEDEDGFEELLLSPEKTSSAILIVLNRSRFEIEKTFASGFTIRSIRTAIESDRDRIVFFSRNVISASLCMPSNRFIVVWYDFRSMYSSGRFEFTRTNTYMIPEELAIGQPIE